MEAVRGRGRERPIRRHPLGERGRVPPVGARGGQAGGLLARHLPGGPALGHLPGPRPRRGRVHVAGAEPEPGPVRVPRALRGALLPELRAPGGHQRLHGGDAARRVPDPVPARARHPQRRGRGAVRAGPRSGARVPGGGRRAQGRRPGARRVGAAGEGQGPPAAVRGLLQAGAAPPERVPAHRRQGALGEPVHGPGPQRQGARRRAAGEAEGVLQRAGRFRGPDAAAAGAGPDADGGDAVREAGGGDAVPEHQGQHPGGRRVRAHVRAQRGVAAGEPGGGGGGGRAPRQAAGARVPGVRQVHVRGHQDGARVREALPLRQERDLLRLPRRVRLISPPNVTYCACVLLFYFSNNPKNVISNGVLLSFLQ
ncbi:hypothetical protein PAHAL_5G223800 [Panicum hallii]|uniref:Uncharacterized protein n=1 Tax=Panicum hallii TaxID=206008 RepID=A0A2T8IKV5_9POAL|nr:hypothetical protein PAHAL_5G223800 [Panicum hallii]